MSSFLGAGILKGVLNEEYYSDLQLASLDEQFLNDNDTQICHRVKFNEISLDLWTKNHPPA